MGDPRPALYSTHHYHAIITDRDGDALTLDADHRRYAAVELAIRDLEKGSDLSTARRVTSMRTPRGPVSLRSPTTWCAGSRHSDSRSSDHSSPRRCDASSSRCLVELHSPLDDATFTCPRSGPGPSSASSASADSSTYRSSRFAFEVARGTPGDFQREQVRPPPPGELRTNHVPFAYEIAVEERVLIGGHLSKVLTTTRHAGSGQDLGGRERPARFTPDRKVGLGAERLRQLPPTLQLAFK